MNRKVVGAAVVLLLGAAALIIRMSEVPVPVPGIPSQVTSRTVPSDPGTGPRAVTPAAPSLSPTLDPTPEPTADIVLPSAQTGKGG